jgi:hypothetical protein
MASTGRHLVVLCHGLTGTPSTVAFIARCIEEAHSDAQLLIHASRANYGICSSYFTTSDGIDAGGARLAHEIRELIQQHSHVSHLSLVGISLGGLYARAALAHLTDLHEISFQNFITFATPHLGVRGHLFRPLNAAVSAGLIGATGSQLLMQDMPEERNGIGPMPLLAWMVHPASPQHGMLRRFVNKVIVANLENDDKVPHWSAALTRDPGVLPGLSRGSSAAPPKAQSPHVRAVYRQPALAPDATAYAAGSETGAALAGFDLDSPEASMATHLRSMGGWTTVDVLFTEWPAFLFNHLRVAVSRSWVAGVGSDVPRFVCRHLFDPATPRGRTTVRRSSVLEHSSYDSSKASPTDDSSETSAFLERRVKSS